MGASIKVGLGLRAKKYFCKALSLGGMALSKKEIAYLLLMKHHLTINLFKVGRLFCSL